MKVQGQSRKMKTQLAEPVQYALPLGGEDVPINPLLGQSVRLAWAGQISCIACDRNIKKSFSQGYCYPCFRKLAECDSCIVKPELCHYAAGTCREPTWGEANCMIPHTVYLANSSAIKVGITRGEAPIGRWIDQGASQGLAIRRVPTRLESGRLEVALKDFVADKTNWRKMLQGRPESIDLVAERDALLARYAQSAPDALLPGDPLPEAEVAEIAYPVLEYPKKIVSHNLDKNGLLEGTLQGIKGQYWILDTGVINLRKYGGYHLELTSA